MKAEEIAYPPLDTPKPVAENLWIVDSGPIKVMGLLPLPIRMTVIRLSGGGLLLHSPTPFRFALKQELDALGRVEHLVAPNSAHWTFVKEWQSHLPDALTWAAPGLRDRAPVRKSGVRLDRDLGEAAPEAWAGEIEQVVVPGGGGFAELAFFHKPTRSLVLTDLVLNLEPRKLPLAMRPLAYVTGITAPGGRAPIYLRKIVRAEGERARAAARRLVALGPERVIFTHGKWFEQDGAARLRRSLSWLL
ncbi:MAG TPA: DUF4336 domain-containing protein [Mesorhizobium sp.]|jgi:hypothetical protein|nr:DUF4336 domain-containing protein [Mesorhizobium sp.]